MGVSIGQEPLDFGEEESPAAPIAAGDWVRLIPHHSRPLGRVLEVRRDPFWGERAARVEFVEKLPTHWVRLRLLERAEPGGEGV